MRPSGYVLVFCFSPIFLDLTVNNYSKKVVNLTTIIRTFSFWIGHETNPARI